MLLLKLRLIYTPNQQPRGDSIKQMIYLFDSVLTNHGNDMLDIFKKFNDREQVHIINTENFNSIDELVNTLHSLEDKLSSKDIVLFTWIMPKNNLVDLAVDKLSQKCHVICSAGNLSQPVSHYSPARVSSVITIGCLNKSSKPAQLSNLPTTEKSLEWMYGTNIQLSNGRAISGTSASAAIYAALFAKAIKFKNPQRFMQKAKTLLGKKFKAELNPN